ncbi:MAG: molecular chaperone TorD family protein [Acidobacteriia bacterium]|nr:molecular chaperone TorD family protein [Terriglobia bacterium]
MKPATGNFVDHRNQAPAALVLALSDWWSQPSPARITLWSSSHYMQRIKAICAPSGQQPEAPLGANVDKLLSTIHFERDGLIAEYERLFVGPAAPPCPPYEAVWRTDRPKHEQGTVVGQCTEEVKQLYRDMGMRLRPGEVELADHIAIELEALTYAWNSGVNVRVVEEILDRLQVWLPRFCASVVANSRSEFYRGLADLTLEFLLGERTVPVRAEA